MTFSASRTTAGKIFVEDWAGGNYNNWSRNVVNAITDSLVSGEEQITNATRSSATYWIYDHTDTGSQHHATAVTSIPTNCIAEALTRIKSVANAEMGQVGIGFVKNSDKTIHAYVCMRDGSGASVAVDAEGIAATTDQTISGKTSDTKYRLKIVKTGTSYQFYWNETSLGNAITDVDAVDRFAILVGAYNGTYSFLTYGGLDNIALYASETITMNQLPDGDYFKIWKGANTYNGSAASGGASTLSISSLSDRPPYDKIAIYDSGNNKVSDDLFANDVWGGDVYSAAELISVTDSAVGTEAITVGDFEAISVTDSGAGSEILAVGEWIIVTDTGLGTEAIYFLGELMIDGLRLDHALRVRVSEPTTISSKPISVGLPTRTYLGKQGRTLEIEGWVATVAELNTLTALADGAVHEVQLPTGSRASVHVVDVNAVRPIEPGEYPYSIRAVERMD